MRTILDVVLQHRRGEIDAADAVNAFYPLLYGVSETVARDRLSRIRSAYLGYVETDGLPEDAMAFAWDCFRSNGWTLPIPKEVCCARQAKDLSRSSTCLLTYSAFYLAVAFSKAPPPGSGSGRIFNAFPFSRRMFAGLLAERLQTRIDIKQHVGAFIKRATHNSFLEDLGPNPKKLLPQPIQSVSGRRHFHYFKLWPRFEYWLESNIPRAVYHFLYPLHDRISAQDEGNRQALEEVLENLRFVGSSHFA